MPDPQKRLAVGDLPPCVRRDFETSQAELGPERTLGNYQATAGGWVASIFAPGGHSGGEYLVLAEPREKPDN